MQNGLKKEQMVENKYTSVQSKKKKKPTKNPQLTLGQML